MPEKFSTSLREEGSAHIALLTILVLGVLGLAVSSNINTTQKFSTPSPQVLGENETAQKYAEQAKEASQKAAERQREAAQKTLEQNKESVKINIQSEGKKSEAEIETSSGQKIKTKVEDDGATKIEVEDKTKDESEASGSADNDDDKKNLEDLRSISKFPLRIDLTTNQLIMTKNGTERILTVLPAKAIQNMLRAHLKKGLGPKFFGDATPSIIPESTTSGEPTPESSATASTSPAEEPVTSESAGITVLSNQISLEESDGQAVYKIPAQKHLKLFGIIPITTNVTGFVSADNGILIKEQEPLLSKFIDFLSP